MASEFGELIRRLRREADLTQEQLAERSQLGVRTIHRLENGHPTDARVGTVKRVAAALAGALDVDPEVVWRQLAAAQAPSAVAAGADREAAQAPPQSPVAEGPGDSGPAAVASAVPADRVAEPGLVPRLPLRPVPAGADPLTELADNLARELFGRWVREEEQRRLHDPAPLPARWIPAPGGVVDPWSAADGSGGPGGPGNAGGSGGPGDSDGADRVHHADRADHAADSTREPGPAAVSGPQPGIAELYRRTPSGRLLVLGRAGSGKTVLLLRFVLDCLSTRAPDEPVPVLVGLGSWDPRRTALRDWVIACLLRDHPHLATASPSGASTASVLVDGGWILPVLDGFDEIAEALRQTALRELNATSLPLLLTSRPAEFTAAAAGQTLRRAVGIELVDLTPADLVDYLPRTARPLPPAGHPDGAPTTVWQPVVEQLRDRPDSVASRNLITALTTPLMVQLARGVYSDTRQLDTTPLLDTGRFPTPAALEEHFLTGFVPAVYAEHAADPHSWPARRAQHYLRHLARQLRGPDGDRPDLAWWRLGEGFPVRVRSVTVGVACAVATFLAYVLYIPAGQVTRHADGLPFNVPVFLVDAALLSPLAGLVFGTLHGFLLRRGRLVIEPSRFRLRLPTPSAFRHRDRVAGRRIRPLLLAGGTAGFLLGLASVLSSLAEWSQLPGAVVTRQILWSTALGGLLLGLVFAIASCLVFALLFTLEVPLDPGAAAGPAQLLKMDRSVAVRRAALVTVLVTAAVTLCGWPVSANVSSPAVHVPQPLGLGLRIGMVAGLAGSACYTLAFTAWGQWLLFGRFLLPLTRRLPWAPLTFLGDAYRRGVLRQAGAVYQFRHARLQVQLIESKIEHRTER